jgi:pimeloyl-ACP methyl ester carboxylesterase
MSFDYLDRPGLPRLAYNATQPGEKGAHLPGVVFLGGFKSDMTGTKAMYLEEQCRACGQAFARFDYSGHGQSAGNFESLTLSHWRDDARAVIERLMPGKVVLAGSSMGGWIALLLALDMPERIAGLVGIAAAADFTRSITNQLNEEQRALIAAQGYIEVPSGYENQPYRFTKALIEDGEKHCLLDRDNLIAAPVRLVQGMQDSDVPWQTAFRIRNSIVGDDVEVILVESGNHRLSRPEDLALIDRQVRAVCKIT